MKVVGTRRTDYGIRALLHLAQSDQPRVKAAEIAQAASVPVGFLHQVLQELQRTRLVTSRPSRTGGYSLARSPADITILEIVEALEGPIETRECALRGGECPYDDRCTMHSVWTSAQEALASCLASVTLGQLADREQERTRGPHVAAPVGPRR